MNDLLQQLTSNAIIKIRNQFTGIFAIPETVIWHLEAEHCTHRGQYYKGKRQGINALEVLLDEAIAEMNRIERLYEDRKMALKTLYPDLNDYDIAEMARNYE